jgi:hypothetical protein
MGKKYVLPKITVEEAAGNDEDRLVLKSIALDRETGDWLAADGYRALIVPAYELDAEDEAEEEYEGRRVCVIPTEKWEMMRRLHKENDGAYLAIEDEQAVLHTDGADYRVDLRPDTYPDVYSIVPKHIVGRQTFRVSIDAKMLYQMARAFYKRTHSWRVTMEYTLDEPGSTYRDHSMNTLRVKPLGAGPSEAYGLLMPVDGGQCGDPNGVAYDLEWKPGHRDSHRVQQIYHTLMTAAQSWHQVPGDTKAIVDSLVMLVDGVHRHEVAAVVDKVVASWKKQEDQETSEDS